MSTTKHSADTIHKITAMALTLWLCTGVTRLLLVVWFLPTSKQTSSQSANNTRSRTARTTTTTTCIVFSTAAQKLARNAHQPTLTTTSMTLFLAAQ
jgi:hypothetical protein